MKTLVGLALAGSLVMLAGCATSSPKYINGRYYMTGDSQCYYYRQVAVNAIACYDSKKRFTHNRYAMSDQQLFMYQHEESLRQARDQQILSNTAIRRPVQCTNIMGIVNCY